MKIKQVLLIGVLCIFALSCSQESSMEGGSGDSTRAAKIDSELFNQSMNQLVTSSAIWPSLEREIKIRAIEVVINLYKVRENAAILNSSKFYVNKIDESLSQDPDLMALPLPQIVKIIAVMEYDFYNGQNKDELAREVLGENLYQSNKRRLEEEATLSGNR